MVSVVREGDVLVTCEPVPAIGMTHGALHSQAALNASSRQGLRWLPAILSKRLRESAFDR